MNHSFPHRMLAVLARTVLALFEDPLATLADVAFWVSLTLTFWALWLLIKHTGAWVTRRVADDALDREYAELCDSFSGDDTGETLRLPGVTHLGRPAPPPPARQIRRRRMPGVRIPGRRMRRHTTTPSSSDRRPQ